MGNNENNVQEQVKKVKKDVPKGNAAKGFVVAALLIVFLGIGFGLGFLCSKGWNPFATKASSKKIDESKPWVYDVDFQGKQVGDENTADYVKVPYININSEDAKKTNDKIKELYENFNEDFEGEITNAKDSRISIRYDKYESTKYVSIIIKEDYGFKNGSGSTMKEYAYTFDLETLKLVSFDEILNAKQYSKEEVNQKISALISKTKESIKNGPYSETAKVSFNNDFYIDENGKVKVLISINDTTFGFRLRHVFMGYGIDEDTTVEENAKIENGKYKRTTDGEASGATLEISNATADSFNFVIDAYRYTRPDDIQWCIDNGGVNIGKLEGIAKRIDTDKFEYEETNKDILELCGGVYRTQFTIHPDNTISIVTIMASSESDPYCGGGVTLVGSYSVEK